MLPSGGRNLTDDAVSQIASSASLAPDSPEEPPPEEPEPEPVETIEETMRRVRNIEESYEYDEHVAVPGGEVLCVVGNTEMPLDMDKWEKDRRLVRYLEQDEAQLPGYEAPRKVYMNFLAPELREQAENVENEKLQVIRLKSELISSRFSTASCLELVSASDDVFSDVVTELGPNLDMEALDNVMGIIFRKKEEGTFITTDNDKFKEIAQCMIYPKLKDGGVTLRSMYPYYEKIVQVDSRIVIKKVLVPLVRDGIPLHKSLLRGIDLDVLILKVLRWVTLEELILNDQLILVLNLAMEFKFPSAPGAELLLSVLDLSFKKQPKLLPIGSFFYGILRRFPDSFTLEHLKRAMEINRENETMFHEPIKKVLTCQLEKRDLERQGRARYTGQSQ